jgi:antitoxin YefM
MYTTTFHLNTQELNDDIIASIKTMFGKKNIEIVVSEAMDETEYLLKSPANKKRLLKAVKEVKRGKDLITFSPTEFKKLNKELLSGKKKG